jgi:single-strand selective monofunctional uracil DNA glycosylase
MPDTPINRIIDRLLLGTHSLTFSHPVSHVYNPLTYARSAYQAYYSRYGRPVKEIILLGMNPGPWGMVQTGIPFGDGEMVRNWLNIHVPVGHPAIEHPKRPVSGHDCPRGEISGRRLWGWAKQRFKTPDSFFQRFWVANYCPLVFMEASGRNRTPDKLPRSEREPLQAVCDSALLDTVRWLRPRYVVGIGKFAALQAERALSDTGVSIGQITHPSPANPKANQGWAERVNHELKALGIRI